MVRIVRNAVIIFLVAPALGLAADVEILSDKEVTYESQSFTVGVDDIADYLSDPERDERDFGVFGNDFDGFFLGPDVFKNNATQCQKLCYSEQQDASEEERCVVVCGNGTQ